MSAVVRGDALRLPLRDGSVDLVVTSPPYFAQRSYQDDGEHYEGQIGQEPTPADFLAALWQVTAECVRALKPSGSIFVNLGDKYAGSGGHNNSSLAPPRTGEFGTRKHNKQAPRTALVDKDRSHALERARASRRNAPDAYNKATIGGARNKSLLGLPWRYAIGCIDELELILRAEIVWAKPNGLPESVTDRVHRRHEQWFHFTKEPTYYCDLDPIREQHIHGGIGLTWDERRTSGEGTRHGNLAGGASEGSTTAKAGHPAGKAPGSVWEVATEPLVVPDHLDVDHFAAFPREWPRRLILGWCPPGGVVLDPFGGSGTTAMVARALGRHGVSLDMSADYCRLASWRIFDSDGASRVRTRTNAERQGALL